MKKTCTACGKQIPSSALDCVFCGAKQSVPVQVATLEMTIDGEPSPKTSEGIAAPASASAPAPAPAPASASAPVPASAPTPALATALGFDAASRLVTGLTGVTWILLFYLPWNGTRSWELLQTLGGLDFVRHLLLLTGGMVLVTVSICPLPTNFRASVALGVAALSVVLSVVVGTEGRDATAKIYCAIVLFLSATTVALHLTSLLSRSKRKALS